MYTNQGLDPSGMFAIFNAARQAKMQEENHAMQTQLFQQQQQARSAAVAEQQRQRDEATATDEGNAVAYMAKIAQEAPQNYEQARAGIIARLPQLEQALPMDPGAFGAQPTVGAQIANAGAVGPELIDRFKAIGASVEQPLRTQDVSEFSTIFGKPNDTRTWDPNTRLQFGEWQDSQKRNKSGSGKDMIIELRKEFQGLQPVKDTQQILAAAEKIKRSGAGGPGAINMIFGFMKLVDPSSTVREGEAAMAQNAGGIPAAIRNAYNALLTGDKLSPELRGQFQAETDRLVSAQLSRYDAIAEPYRKEAKQYGLDAERVVFPLGYATSPAKTQPVNPAVPTTPTPGTEGMSRKQLEEAAR